MSMEKKYCAYCKTHTKHEFEGYCWVCQKCVEDILSDTDSSSYSDDRTLFILVQQKK